MNDWREVRLGDICDIYDGPHATPPKTESGQIFLGISSLGFDGRINSSHFEYVSEEVFEKWTRRIEPKYQDIVFSYETKLGVAAMIPEGFKCCLGRRMGLLRPKDSIEPRFLIYAYLAPNFQKVIHERTYHGSTVDRIPLKEIADFPVNIPDLTEQKAIASVLSSLDDKIDLLHRQNKTLEAMAETLFRQWFVEEAEDSWEEKSLGDFVKIIDNRGKTPPYQDMPTPYPIIEVNALAGKNRLVDYSVIRKYVSEDTFNTWFRGHPKKFDSLISTVGSIGEISMFLIEKGSIAQNVIALSAIKISPLYLFEFLKHSREVIKELDIGSVQPSIKVPHLLSIRMAIPPIKKLELFDYQVKNYLEKMILNQNQIHILESLRDTLLPKLMSGEVRVDYS